MRDMKAEPPRRPAFSDLRRFAGGPEFSGKTKAIVQDRLKKLHDEPSSFLNLRVKDIEAGAPD
jgi:hypothetical protein